MKIKVLGVGNILRADDGVGVRVIEHLREHSPLAHAQDIEIVEIGLGGINIVADLTNADAAVIVDAIHTHDIPPGEARIFSAEQVRVKFVKDSLDFHHASVGVALKLIEALGMTIPIKFVVVSPASLEYEPELTQQVQSNFAKTCALVEQAVEELRKNV